MKRIFLRNMALIVSIIGLSLVMVYSVHKPQPKEPDPVKPVKPVNAKQEKKATVKPKPKNTELIETSPPVQTETNIEPAAKAANIIAIKTKVKSEEEASPPTVPKPVEGVPVSRSTAHTYSNNPDYPLLSKVQGSYGQFRYRDASGGRIDIDPQWINDNIVTIVLPGLNRSVEVHKAAADNFMAAFNYIKNGSATINGREVSLLSLINSMDGTFVTRHVNWNSSRGLSNHSWGIAIDINAADHFRYINPASEPNDPNLILWEKAFKPAGFSWGNGYGDSMHFELLN